VFSAGQPEAGPPRAEGGSAFGGKSRDLAFYRKIPVAGGDLKAEIWRFTVKFLWRAAI
jgi:hypothetical protein